MATVGSSPAWLQLSKVELRQGLTASKDLPAAIATVGSSAGCTTASTRIW